VSGDVFCFIENALLMVIKGYHANLSFIHNCIIENKSSAGNILAIIPMQKYIVQSVIIHKVKTENIVLFLSSCLKYFVKEMKETILVALETVWIREQAY